MAKAIENQIEKGLLCRGRETEKGMGVERGCCRQRRLCKTRTDALQAGGDRTAVLNHRIKDLGLKGTLKAI